MHVLHRAARVAAPTYAALCEQIRGSPVVPRRNRLARRSVRHWLWAFATPETTVYRICPGRGFDEAAAVLGADFDGVLVRDGWAPYRRFTAALHQTCLAHLLRRARTLSADHPHSPWAARVQAVLTDALALRGRRAAHALTDHGLAVARGRLLARLGRLLDTAPALPAAQRFAAHLDREFAAASPSCGRPRWTPPTGVPSKPSARPSSIAKSVAAIGRPAARRPNRSSPASSAPHDSGSSTSPNSLPRCSGVRTPPCPRPSKPRPARSSSAKQRPLAFGACSADFFCSATTR